MEYKEHIYKNLTGNARRKLVKKIEMFPNGSQSVVWLNESVLVHFFKHIYMSSSLLFSKSVKIFIAARFRHAAYKIIKKQNIGFSTSSWHKTDECRNGKATKWERMWVEILVKLRQDFRHALWPAQLELCSVLQSLGRSTCSESRTFNSVQKCWCNQCRRVGLISQESRG